MTYQALARKWRPHRFDELVGQAHVVRALANALDQGRVHHAFLFTGTRGVGKTTIARILAKCVNCERGVSSTPCGECAACTEIDEGRHPDLIEVDAASRARVDETRELMGNVQFAPTRARHKVYLIDEVHMFSDASFNALLKTLEEPPPHVKFLLATTDPQRMPVTVLSRCLQFSLKRLPAGQIRERLAEILGAEAVAFEEPALRLLARAADGSLRDALSLLDQAIAHGGGRVEAEPVRAMLGLLDRDHVRSLVEHLAASDGPALLGAVEALAGEVTDWGEALAELLSALTRIAVAQAVPDSLDDEDEEAPWLRELAARLAPEDVQLYYQIGLIGRRDLPLAPDPRTGFEMTLLRMLAFVPLDEVAGGDAGEEDAGLAPPAAARRPRAPAGAESRRGDSAESPSPAAVPAPAAPRRGDSAESPSPAADPAHAAPRRDDSAASPPPARASARAEPPGDDSAQAHVRAPARDAAESPPESPAPERRPAAASPPAPQSAPAPPAAARGPAPGGGAVRDAADSTDSIDSTDFADSADSAACAGAADWAAVVAQLGLTGLARELASNCELIALEPGRVLLRLAPQHRPLAAGRGAARLEQALSQHFGRALELVLEVTGRSAGTPAEIARRDRERRREDAARALGSDPGVAAILDTFGGALEPDSITPSDAPPGQ